MCEVIIHRAKGGCCLSSPALLRGTLCIFSASWQSSLKDRLPVHAARTLGICGARAGSRRGATGRDNLRKTLGLDRVLRLLNGSFPFTGEPPRKPGCTGRVFRHARLGPSLLQPLPSPPGHLLPRDGPAGTSAAPGRAVPAAASPRRGERWCCQPQRPRSAAPEHTFRLLLAGTRNQLPHFARAGDRGEASAVLFSPLQ